MLAVVVVELMEERLELVAQAVAVQELIIALQQ
jgi:hypothetical protein